MTKNTRPDRLPDTGREMERLLRSDSLKVIPNDEAAAREAAEAIFGKLVANCYREELVTIGNEVDAGKGHKR